MAYTYAVESVLQGIPDVSCLEGDESSLYLGTNDGQLLHYVIHKDDPESDALDYTYLLASKQVAPGNAPPRSIVLLPEVQLAAVCANETLSFYALPEFAPVSNLRVIKNVQGILRNCDLSQRVDVDSSALITIFTTKKIRQVKVSRLAVKLVKEVEYAGCLAACQRGAILCVATRSSYDLVDLDNKARIPLFPVVQGESEPVGHRYDEYMPRIVSPTPNEFLLASGSPEAPTTMGMFITLSGEITRGTVMFEGYPKKLVVDAAHILALLPDGVIEVHDLATQMKITSIVDREIVDLYFSGQQTPVVSKQHLRRMLRTRMIQDEEKPGLDDLNDARRISDISSSILLRKTQGVGALITETTLITIDRDIDAQNLEAALSAAEILSRNTPAAFAERLFHELAYIHQKAGLLYFQRMLFDDAMDHFKQGNIDPRVLISFYPEFGVTRKGAKIYAGTEAAIDSTPTAEVIIHDNLVRTVDEQDTLRELETIMQANALELLRRHLTAYRDKKGLNSAQVDEDATNLFAIVETTLLKILLRMDPADANSKLDVFFEVEVEDAETVYAILQEHGQWSRLAALYSNNSRHEDALEIWQKLATESLHDDNFSGNIYEHIKNYLLNFADDAMLWNYGMWLIHNATAHGIELFCHAIDAKLVTFRLQDVLDELRNDTAQSGTHLMLLEHLVLIRKTDDAALTNELMTLYALQMTQQLNEQEVMHFLLTSIEDYRNLQVPKVPFLVFVADSVVRSSSETITHFVALRTNFINLMQTSKEYDAEKTLGIIMQHRDVMLAERILLYGRLSHHADSLNLLVHDLKDFDSAEVYCYHGGISLSQIRISSDKSETVVMRRKLFPLLFKEYLQLDGVESHREQGCKLLNRWGNYIDIGHILEHIPDQWTLDSISIFLVGALSKLTGTKRESQIRRALARAQLNARSSRKFVLID